MRLDVSHFIHMICEWKSLRKSNNNAARNVYKRALAHAYQMNDLNSLSSFLGSLLTVSLSQFIGSGPNNLPVPAESRIQLINDIICGVTTKKFEENNFCGDRLTDSKDDENYVGVTDWNTWGRVIYKRANTAATQSESGNIINGCFNPEFARQFKTNLLPYVAFWTGIMRPHFNRGEGRASSSAVESEFAQLKGRSLQGAISTRACGFSCFEAHRGSHRWSGEIKVNHNRCERRMC